MPAPQESGLVEHRQPIAAPAQTGVVPVHATQEGPQAAAVLQLTQLVPLQVAPVPHELPLQTHWPPLQLGVEPEQGVHEAPQAAAVSHATQTLPEQRLPGPHWPSLTHWTQAPLLHTLPSSGQFAHEAPQ